MQKDFLIAEREHTKQNILIFLKRLKYLLLNTKNKNQKDKTLYAQMINEIAYNINAETKNYTNIIR